MSRSAPNLEDAVRRMTPVSTPPEQREQVAALLTLLKHMPQTLSEEAAYKLISPAGETISLPESVFVLLERIIEVLASGDAITVVPVARALTTQQAANLLNVSRQYVVQLLDEGRIPSHRTGTHRRVHMSDLLDYKRQRDSDRMTALDELAALSQTFGGYDELGE